MSERKLKNAQKLKLNDGKVHSGPLLDINLDGDVACTIYPYVVEIAIERIVLWPKGTSLIECFLTGSVSEKLMNFNSNIKMQIAKDKRA